MSKNILKFLTCSGGNFALS